MTVTAVTPRFAPCTLCGGLIDTLEGSVSVENHFRYVHQLSDDQVELRKGRYPGWKTPKPGKAAGRKDDT